MSTIKIVTDSAADIPAQLRKDLDIQVLPFSIVMNDQEFRDGVDFTPQEFYRQLLDAPQIPTHSQLNPMVFEELYDKALADGVEELIYVAINAKGSATYQNAVATREQFLADHPGCPMGIHVIDSKTYTMCYGYAVVQGAKKAQEGAGIDQVLSTIRDWLDHVGLVFSPFDLKYAKRSGRVSAAAAFLGEALGMKPLMTFENGESKVLSKVRGDKSVIPAQLARAQAEMAPGSPYLCICGIDEGHNQDLAEACEKAFGYPPELSFCIGGVIAINAGPNLVGIVYRRK
jgi:DegV family protein with EDD domain